MKGYGNGTTSNGVALDREDVQNNILSWAELLRGSKSEEQPGPFGYQLSPFWAGIRIRESPYLVEYVATKRRVFHLRKKGKRKVWYPTGAYWSCLSTVPSRSVYRLPDGSIACHPTVAEQLRKQLSTRT